MQMAEIATGFTHPDVNTGLSRPERPRWRRALTGSVARVLLTLILADAGAACSHPTSDTTPAPVEVTTTTPAAGAEAAPTTPTTTGKEPIESNPAFVQQLKANLAAVYQNVGVVSPGNDLTEKDIDAACIALGVMPGPDGKTETGLGPNHRYTTDDLNRLTAIANAGKPLPEYLPKGQPDLYILNPIDSCGAGLVLRQDGSANPDWKYLMPGDGNNIDASEPAAFGQ
jgi:hypothetical protein